MNMGSWNHHHHTHNLGRQSNNNNNNKRTTISDHHLLSPILFGNYPNNNFKIYHNPNNPHHFTSLTRCHSTNADTTDNANDNANDNEEELDEYDKFQIATGGILSDNHASASPATATANDTHFSDPNNNNNNTLSSLPPLPKFLIDDDMDEDDSPLFATSSSSIPPPPPTTTITTIGNTNENGETKFQMEQQQKQIDLLMEMVKNQQLQVQQQLQLQQQQHQQQQQPKPISPTASSPTATLLDDNSEQEESDFADDDAIYFTSPQPQLIPNSSNSDNASSSTTTTTSTTIVTPLKAMLFIDGTWLYYSLHHRREDDCPIIRKFGKGWQSKYKFDWHALPRIVCEQMQMQQTNQGWSSNAALLDSPSDATMANNKNSIISQPPPQRPVEVVRASVFTSYKKTTDPQSIRVRMYEEMADANYDVHMMETVGKGEKCVDIQLAVEMLHYATVPDAYDVAILLSGDKDFIPAMIRTRQKGRKVGVVSMRTGCNRALYEGSNIKDFDVVWIEDFLDRLVVKMSPEELDLRRRGSNSARNRGSGIVSPFTMMKVTYDFIKNSPSGQVSSRDVGRYLKSITIGNINMLDDMKLTFGGLKQFLAERVPFVFTVTNRDWDEIRDTKDRTFWVEVNKDSTEALVQEADNTKFSEHEKIFWSEYQAGNWTVSNTEQPYYHTEENIVSAGKDVDGGDERNITASEEAFELPPELKLDYSTYTVVQLKEVCRERKLPISGTKAILLQRIEEDVDIHTKVLHQMFEEKKNEEKKNEQKFTNQQHQRIRMDMTRSKMGSRLISKTNNASNNNNKSTSSKSTPTSSNRQSTVNNRQQTNVKPAITRHLEDMIKEYLEASGGQAGSRDVGRYLAANRVSGVASSNGKKQMTALQELKDNYGSLAHFIGCRNDVFVRIRDTSQIKQDDYGFPITLKK